MSHPLSTPSGINRATPIPRSPDGSPLPSAKIAELRAKERERQAVATINEAFDKSAAEYDAKVGPLDPVETDRRLDLWDQKPLPPLKEQGKRVSKAQLATPEDEASLQATYGKSSEELAAEAEKGYKFDTDITRWPAEDKDITTDTTVGFAPETDKTINVGPEFDAEMERPAAGLPVNRTEEVVVGEVVTPIGRDLDKEHDIVVDAKPAEPAKKAPAKKAPAKTQAQKNREIANAHKKPEAKGADLGRLGSGGDTK